MTSRIDAISTSTHALSQPHIQQRREAVVGDSRKSEEVNNPSKLDAVVQPSVSKLSQAVDGLNGAFEVVRTHLRFRLHEDTHRHYVEIVDTLANEVIREVPPKRFLDMIADMYQFRGIIVDEKR